MKNENENEKQKQKRDDTRQIMKAFGLLTQLGLSMVSCILIGLFAGLFLDRLFGASPVFVIIFIVTGSVAAIKVLYDISKDWK